MEIELPEIDISKISDKVLAQQITQLIQFVQQQANEIIKLTTALEQANQEIARLKGQPKKPQFSSPTVALLKLREKVTALRSVTNFF